MQSRRRPKNAKSFTVFVGRGIPCHCVPNSIYYDDDDIRCAQTYSFALPWPEAQEQEQKSLVGSKLQTCMSGLANDFSMWGVDG